MALYHLQVDEDGNKVGVFNDPLPWWKENCNRFPLVAALARQMLATPATSAQSERLFSKAGQIVTDRRSSLGSDSVELLLFFKHRVARGGVRVRGGSHEARQEAEKRGISRGTDEKRGTQEPCEHFTFPSASDSFPVV